MRTPFDIPTLDRYPKPEKPDFLKAMRDVSSKYEKIKSGIAVLLENYYNDHHDFKLKESQKASACRKRSTASRKDIQHSTFRPNELSAFC